MTVCKHCGRPRIDDADAWQDGWAPHLQDGEAPECGARSGHELGIADCYAAQVKLVAAQNSRLTAILARVREACAVSEPVEWYSGRNVHAAIRNNLRAEILALLGEP